MRGGSPASEKAASLYFLNPLVIWVSSGWGQYDSLPAFFSALALYVIYAKRKSLTSGIGVLTAVLYKIYPIVLLLPTYFSQRGESSFLRRNIFLAPFAAALAFAVALTRSQLVQFVQNWFLPATFGNILGFGLTYWSISLFLQPPLADFQAFEVFSSVVFLILLGISALLVVRYRKGEQMSYIMLSSLLLICSYFLSQRYIAEDFSVLYFLILAFVVMEGVVSPKLYYLSALVAFVYTQKNFPYYLLPAASLNQKLFIPIFQLTESTREVVAQGGTLVLAPTPISGAVLAILGTIFSALTSIVFVRSLQAIRKLGPEEAPSPGSE